MGSGDGTASGGQRRGMSQEIFLRMSGRVKNDSQVSNAAFQRDGKCRRRSRRKGWEFAELTLGRGPEIPVGLQMEPSNMSTEEIDPQDLGWKGVLGAGGWWLQPQNWVTSPRGRIEMRNECSETLLGNRKSKRSTSLQKPPSWPVQPFQ